MSKPQPRPCEHFTVAEHLARRLPVGTRGAYRRPNRDDARGDRAPWLIAGNIFAALHGPMRRRGCQAFVSNLIVRRDDVDSFAALPDVVVRCGPLSDSTVRALSDPAVIFEVLSQGAEQEDRTRKFMSYQAIPSLQACVLVRQDKPRVEV